MLRVIIRWDRRLCTYLLVFNLQPRKTSGRRPSEAFRTRRRFKGGVCPSKEVGGIIFIGMERKKEIKKERRKALFS